MLDMDRGRNTPGYCKCGESGSEVREYFEGGTLEYSDWNFRVRFCTSDFGITFQRCSGLELVVVTDVDYAGKDTDRRLVAGGVMMCADARMCSFSMTQKCVTLSTNETDNVALGDAIKEVMFIRYVWICILPVFGATCMTAFEDNQGARHLAENPVCTSNSTHIDVTTPFSQGSYFPGGVYHYSRKIGGAACRLSHKATR